MAKRRKVLENRIDGLRHYLKNNMQYTGITKIACPYFTLAIQNNPPSVTILNEDDIPPSFKEAVLTWKINKTAIKDAIKGGQAIPGAVLTSGTRLVIK